MYVISVADGYLSDIEASVDCYYKMLQSVITQTGADLGEEIQILASSPSESSQYYYANGSKDVPPLSVSMTSVAAS
jgi:hypothetical protein